MITDKNKDITSIEYNHLNLPTIVKFGTANTKKITYIYDATGLKLKKIVTDNSNTTSTEYRGNYIYENDGLKFFSHPEGYVEPVGKSFGYVYQYKDHLGNIRLSYSDTSGDGSINPNLEIVEENNYYPFGLKHKGYNNNVSANSNSVASKFKYNGKELNDELGLNMYDYGARFYDPTLGKWFTPDALAEKYYDQSIYTYALNNPILYIDPDGNQVEMCCEGLINLAKNYYGGLWGGVVKTYDGAVEGAKQLVSDPVGTVKTAASNHFDRFTTREGIMGVLDTAVTFDGNNPITSLVMEVKDAALSEDPVKSFGESQGEGIAEKSILLMGEGGTVLFGRGLSLLSKTDDVVKVGSNSSVSPMAGKRLGHTFTKHGSQNTNQLLQQANGSGLPVGQWLDNVAAESIIAKNLEKMKNGAITVPIPKGVGRVINPDGSFSVATHARLVPSGSGVKTAYPLIQE
ncbi:RHS repeat-associated core domain-containing protein [uncultured Psychroserpens sp.]|uniref:RHS repeat domain-containing protein n=1 Tax=uncultured Psychroserpens sp. TaxID=255436 RepID=UPI002603B675|nr:RHS repeat-associated core domain-containing protein [uncultured Psychroserpens sp.]